MKHMLQRVEEVEERMDCHSLELKGLKKQVEEISREQRYMRYKMEDQENRNRRKNIRIRGLPEQSGEDNLQEQMDEIFGHMLGTKDVTNKIKFERIHRIRKPPEVGAEVPRDVIARFHNYQDKELINRYMKANQPPKYRETSLQVFPDLSGETLSRRRTLKPLLDVLKSQNIQYTWGFPACLTGRKDGRAATLRFPEETPNFCRRLDIDLIEIPGWWERSEQIDSPEEAQAWQPVWKRPPGRKK